MCVGEPTGRDQTHHRRVFVPNKQNEAAERDYCDTTPSKFQHERHCVMTSARRGNQLGTKRCGGRGNLLPRLHLHEATSRPFSTSCSPPPPPAACAKLQVDSSASTTNWQYPVLHLQQHLRVVVESSRSGWRRPGRAPTSRREPDSWPGGSRSPWTEPRRRWAPHTASSTWYYTSPCVQEKFVYLLFIVQTMKYVMK